MSNTIAGMPGASAVGVPPEAHKPTGDRGEFLETLEGFLNQVGQLQSDAHQQVGELLRGEGQDVHTAMIAVEKADLAFQLMMQVRNKIVQAYQEIARMPF